MTVREQARIIREMCNAIDAIDRADPRPRIVNIQPPEGYEDKVNLIKLDTEDGATYLKAEDIVLIGPRTEKAGKLPARRVAFGSNVYIFVLDTAQNLEALGLHDEATALLEAMARQLAMTEKPKRTRRKVAQ